MGWPVSGSLRNSATMVPVNRIALHRNKGERLESGIMMVMVIVVVG